MHFISRLLLSLPRALLAPVIFLLAGWYGGAKYGAPDLVIRAVDGVIARGKVLLSPLIEEGVDRSGEIASSAVEQGSDYVVGTVEQMLEQLAEPPTETGEDDATDEEVPAEGAAEEQEDDDTDSGRTDEAPPASVPLPTPTGESDGIILCKMRISNPPRGGTAESNIGGSGETAAYKGVNLLLMPATKSCLSSGYGYRNGQLHRGVDYFSDTGGDVLAAAGGTIVEAVSRSDYGNMIVIDHGNDVFTRYAHLARFGAGVREGASVSQGQTLGPIGNSGSSTIVHLHYEILTGDYNTNAKSFGLEAVDPFGL